MSKLNRIQAEILQFSNQRKSCDLCGSKWIFRKDIKSKYGTCFDIYKDRNT